jgi:inosine-uridine nucleoside N-ribohydrolase
VTYTPELHARLEPIKSKHKAYEMIYDMMSKYKGQKKLHDPLAVCAAIDPSIVEYVSRPVEYA